MASQFLYVDLGPTTANIAIGVLSAIVDNIPLMFAVLTMDPAMSHGQWLLVTLTAGVGGSLLSIGSAAGVALMGLAHGPLYLLQPPEMDLGHRAWAMSPASSRTCSSIRRCSEMNDQSALIRFINHEATAALSSCSPPHWRSSSPISAMPNPTIIFWNFRSRFKSAASGWTRRWSTGSMTASWPFSSFWSAWRSSARCCRAIFHRASRSPCPPWQRLAACSRLP